MGPEGPHGLAPDDQGLACTVGQGDPEACRAHLLDLVRECVRGLQAGTPRRPDYEARELARVRLDRAWARRAWARRAGGWPS